MKSVDVLFVISTILVPLLLISLNYPAIDDFYTYSVPLQNIDFENIEENCNEQCMLEYQSQGYNCNKITNSQYFCFSPIDYNKLQERSGYWEQLIPISYGYLDLIYDDKNSPIGFLKQIKIIDEKSLVATFAPSENTKHMEVKSFPDDDYENIQILEIGDTFIPRCNDKVLFVYKLHDIAIHNDVSYAIFTYRIGTSDAVPCDFPSVLEHSFGIKFD